MTDWHKIVKENNDPLEKWSGYIDDQTIENRFYYPLCAIRDFIYPNGTIITDVDEDGEVYYSIVDHEKYIILLWDYMHYEDFIWDTPEAFNKWCDEIADKIKERIK